MADPKLSSFNIQLSGGFTNDLPEFSLGGARSNTALTSEIADASAPIVGVTIDALAGNGAGAGSVFFDFSETELSWAAPGDTLGTPVGVGTTGAYTLFSATDGYIHVTIAAGSLPTADATATVNVTQSMENLFDDIDKTESIAGDVEYRCFYIWNNDSAETFYNVNAYIKSQPTGADSLELALDSGGMNATAETIANESTAPTGETFTSPTQGSPLAVGNMAAADSIAIWVKRTISANTLVSTPADLSVIGIEVNF